jgi:hypothetical protein
LATGSIGSRSQTTTINYTPFPPTNIHFRFSLCASLKAVLKTRMKVDSQENVSLFLDVTSSLDRQETKEQSESDNKSKRGWSRRENNLNPLFFHSFHSCNVILWIREPPLLVVSRD